MIKIIPEGKKCKKAKWLPEEVLQTAEKRSEVKDKGEKERYIHPNVEFQRTSRRDKKEFLSGQCKEIEENNRMVKTRDLFKETRDTKGTFGKLSRGHRTGKSQFSSQSQRKGNAKEYSNYHTIALISHASKVMLKILQARLQQYVNCELPDVQTGFRKGRGTRDQIANIFWIIEKASEF